MSWIEGVGDEVIFFLLAACALLAILVLTWKSTEVPDSGAVSFRFTITARRPLLEVQPNIPTAPPISNEEVTRTAPPSTEEENSTDPPQTAQPEASNNEGEQDEAADSEAAGEDGVRRRAKPSEVIIKIRLMYMDETQKVVETSNQQSLGDFKRQHFSTELSSGKRVKLIFNAKVLEREAASLSQLGLDDNCVVHCLVIHRPAQTLATTSTDLAANRDGTNHANQDAEGAAATAAAGSFAPLLNPSFGVDDAATARSPQIEAGIDVGGLLVPLFGVILGLVWYCRIAYATHFTTAATIALVGLSGLCLLSLFVVCFPVSAQDVTST